ncbi:MAG TPA: hypothetical protein VEJ87_01870, partial [Acidimicrobiales bacterium]|nr:hypothetical protein [Acidimicrobiales bacterium]
MKRILAAVAVAATSVLGFVAVTAGPAAAEHDPFSFSSFTITGTPFTQAGQTLRESFTVTNR